MFGLTFLHGLFSGTILMYGRPTWYLEFDATTFFVTFLPHIIVAAGMCLDLHLFIANSKTLLLRGIIMPFISFVFVSMGASFLLPQIGFHSVTATDCLVLASLFCSSNLLFGFQLIEDGRENMGWLYEMAIAESTFNTATSILLFGIVRSTDSVSLQPINYLYLLANFSYGVVTSICLGILVALLIVVVIAVSIKLTEPETSVCIEGSLRVKEKMDVVIVRGFLIFMAVCLYVVAQCYGFSPILAIFSYAIITSHYLLPKTDNYEATYCHDHPIVFVLFESILYLWIGNSVARVNHWGYVFSGHATIRSYIAITFVLFILLMVGRVFSVLHFSRFVMTKAEIEEGKPKAYLFGKWAIGNKELENQVIIWWSGFMPSMIAVVLAMEHFEKSMETRHAFMLTGLVSVVYFLSLVYFIGMVTSFKKFLVRIMIRSPNGVLRREKVK